MHRKFPSMDVITCVSAIAWTTVIIAYLSYSFTPTQRDQSTTVMEPSLAYESSRRAIRRHLADLWRRLDVHLPGDGQVRAEVRERCLQMLGEMRTLEENDGYGNWRRQESESLTNLVRSHIESVQNPASCSAARYFTCDFHLGCGLGCGLHNLHYCLVSAQAFGRVLRVTSRRRWHYNRGGGKRKFEDFFQPLSEKCQADPGKGQLLPPTDSSRVITLRDMMVKGSRTDFLPSKVPEQLLKRLEKLHGNPSLWWTGQVAAYLLRLGPYMREFVDEKRDRIGLNGPVVAIHIRRTDKVHSKFEDERVKLYSVEDYMKPVEEYFDLRDLTGNNTTVNRTVFVATDDEAAIQEVKRKYSSKGYTILSDSAPPSGPDRFHDRTSVEALLADVTLLSRSDFLVCTLSSNICRLAFELMQATRVDASDRCHSLDFDWRFIVGNRPKQIAVMSHTPRTAAEMELRVGEEIWLMRNLQNGSTRGQLVKSRRRGTYPSYKVEGLFEPALMPNLTYDIKR